MARQGGVAVFKPETLLDTLLGVLLAIAGGLARLLGRKDKTRLELGVIMSELFIAGFTGLMVLLLARAIGLTGEWTGIISGMAGFGGAKVLDALAKTAMKKVGLDDAPAKDGKDEKDSRD